MAKFHCYPPHHAYARYIQNLYKVRSFINKYHLDLSGHLLDYGSGSGALSAVLIDLVNPLSVTGYEPRVEAIEDSSHLFPRVTHCLTHDHSTLLHGHYDVAFCQYVSAYVEPRSLFISLHKLLRSQGILALETTVPDLLSRLQGFSYSEWKIKLVDYLNLFTLEVCSPSTCNNRSFDYTSSSYTRLKLKQLAETIAGKDSMLYIFKKV